MVVPPALPTLHVHVVLELMYDAASASRFGSDSHPPLTALPTPHVAVIVFAPLLDVPLVV